MTTSSYCESCPEAVSTVNVNNTIVEIDSTEVAFRDEYFQPGDVVANQITLAYSPTSNAAVLLFLSGVNQGQDTVVPANNFTISDKVITLSFAVGAGEVVHVHYLANLT